MAIPIWMASTRAALTAWPTYPPGPADLRSIRVAGVELPARASVALVLVTFLVLFDYQRTFIPDEVQALGVSPAALRYQALERLILFGLVPLLVIVLAFRDRPERYGLRVGAWRLGLPAALLGCALMTPVVIAVVSEPSFAAYYARSAASLPDVLVTNAIDLAPSEFILRGFLMFTLFRGIGPVGIIVAQLPFVFSHLGKPELELFSTMFGGLAYAWLDWRTGSILWSILPHVYILTLAISLSAAAVS